MRALTALAVVSAALLAAPAASAQDPASVFGQLLGTPDVPVMPGAVEGSVQSGAPPAGSTGTVSSTASTATLGSRGRQGVRARNGTRCRGARRRRVCVTYLDGVVRRRCSVRQRRCILYGPDGRRAGRCRLRGDRRVCGRIRRPRTASVGVTRAPRATASGLAWQGWPSPLTPSVGKIEFVKADGRQSSCSGTVVTRTLVLTAAHCLYDARAGGYDRAVYFAPGMYLNQDLGSYSTPYGVWTAVNYWVPGPWAQGDAAFDYGLIEFAPSAGGAIGDIVGTNSITAGIRWGMGARVYAMGYPASGFWSTVQGLYGRSQYACDTTWDYQQATIGSGYELWLSCSMNGGASGGPWFVQLNDGSWTIGGVNDRCFGPNMDSPTAYCTPYSYYMRASYFDERFLGFWQYVQGQLRY